MMKYLAGMWSATLFSFSVFAQNNGSIIGSLVDEKDNTPVELASIRLLKANDSTFVNGTHSDEKGAFFLQEIVAGRYLVHVTYIGYKDIFQPVTVRASQTANLGKLLLGQSDVALQEAIVIGKAAEIVVRGDTIEYNADSYKTPENSVLEDLLKRLPGAEVDKDGKITINGKEIKKILVEGKEFFSEDPTVASKNLPANMVKKVQVVDRKSDMARITGFDDGDEETIINLTVQEGMRKGTMINAMAGIGHDVPENGDTRYEASAVMNRMTDDTRYTLMMGTNNTNNLGAADMGRQRFGGMRGMFRGSGGINESSNVAFGLNKEFSPHFSLNGDAMYNTIDNKAQNEVETETFINQNLDWLERQITNTEEISENFGVNMRMEWKPDTLNTFIFRPNFRYYKRESYENQLFEGFESSGGILGDTLYTGLANSKNYGEGKNGGGTIDVAHKFRKPGRVFSVSLTGSYNESFSQGNSFWIKNIWEKDTYGRNELDRDSTINQRSENDNTTVSYRIFASYVEPIGRNNFLQFAYRYSRSNTENVNSTYDLLDNEFVLNGNQSRSTSRNVTEQRFSLKFKAVREKYNYTIGFNADPSYSLNETLQPYSQDLITVLSPHDNRLPNAMGDSIISSIEQKATNYSPELNFNYLFGRRSNLRIDYMGSLNQPSAKQLADFDDYSDPMNVVTGNPDLKPSYSNRITARFQKSVPESQLFYNVEAQGNFSFNDIVTRTSINPMYRSRYTTYENVNGNWNVRLRGIVNTPLKNKKFSVGDFAMFFYNHANGFINGRENTTKNFSLSNRANANYRSNLFDFGINASISYQNVVNELQPENNRRTYDWGLGAATAWYLPSNITLDSDIEWSDRSGYSSNFNTSQIIWNASLAKQLFNKKYGSGTLKLKIYDILQERKSLNYTVGNGYTQNRISTTLPSFFMCSFIYRVNIFPSGSSATQDDMREQTPRVIMRGGGERGPGGPPPF